MERMGQPREKRQVRFRVQRAPKGSDPLPPREGREVPRGEQRTLGRHCSLYFPGVGRDPRCLCDFLLPHPAVQQRGGEGSGLGSGLAGLAKPDTGRTALASLTPAPAGPPETAGREPSPGARVEGEGLGHGEL